MPVQRSLLGLFVLCAIFPTLSRLSGAEEWSRFRGPNGAGVAPAVELPKSWTEKDFLWSIKLPGAAASSPVIWGDKVFLGSGDPKDGTRMLMAISASDGKTLWMQKYPASTHKQHDQNSYASCTPAVDAERVYFAWATPAEYWLLATDHSGNEKWRVNLGKFESRHGFAASPILAGDLVVITNDQDGPSSLIAVDKAKGEIRWNVPRKQKTPQNASYSTPLLMESKDGTELIVASWGHGISSHRLSDGKTNWETEVFEARPVGQPILAGGLILGNCGEGSGKANVVIAVKPPAKSGDKAEVAYTIDSSSAPYVPSLVAKDKLVFLWSDKGTFTCIDAATGNIHYKERAAGGKNFSSSPIIVGEQVINISSDGELTMVPAKSTWDADSVVHVKLPEGTRATPAVAGGRMFIRTYSGLIAVGKK